MQFRLICFVACSLCIGCDPGNAGNQQDRRVKTAPAAGTLVQKAGAASLASCPNGGAVFEHGFDSNHNGTLDDEEVDGSSVVCHGSDGISCTAIENGDSTKSILCSDGVTTTVSTSTPYEPIRIREALAVDATYPAMAGTTFPTYMSHLLGSPDFGTAGLDLVELTITNGATTDAYVVRVSVELVGFSTPVSYLLDVPAQSSVTTSATPLLDLLKLFDLDASRPGVIHAAVHVEDVIVWEESLPITLASKNTAFLDVDRRPYLASFVTPNDADGEIRSLLREATNHMPNRSMVGYQNMNMTDSSTLPPGWYMLSMWIQIADSSVPESVTITFTRSSGDGGGQLHVLDYANYEKFDRDDPYTARCSLHGPFSPDAELVCGPLTVGWYIALYLNTSSTDDWDFAASRTLTHAGVTDIQMESVYRVLSSRGFRYVNVFGDVLSAPTQKIYYPSESIRNLSGNCIDGTVLYAAVFEAMGMDTYLVLPPGHAYVAIAPWAGSSALIAVETTMLGKADYWSARFAGLDQIIADLTDPEVKILDISALRKMGIRPAPSM